MVTLYRMAKLITVLLSNNQIVYIIYYVCYNYNVELCVSISYLVSHASALGIYLKKTLWDANALFRYKPNSKA